MSERPRDLKVRTYDYARSVIRVFRALPKDDVGRTLGRQLLRSATSVGVNYYALALSSKPSLEMSQP